MRGLAARPPRAPQVPTGRASMPAAEAHRPRLVNRALLISGVATGLWLVGTLGHASAAHAAAATAAPHPATVAVQAAHLLHGLPTLPSGAPAPTAIHLLQQGKTATTGCAVASITRTPGRLTTAAGQGLHGVTSTVPRTGSTVLASGPAVLARVLSGKPILAPILSGHPLPGRPLPGVPVSGPRLPVPPSTGLAIPPSAPTTSHPITRDAPAAGLTGGLLLPWSGVASQPLKTAGARIAGYRSELRPAPATPRRPDGPPLPAPPADPAAATGGPGTGFGSGNLDFVLQPAQPAIAPDHRPAGLPAFESRPPRERATAPSVSPD